VDVNSSNRLLIMKRHEHARLVALSQIHAREIRIMELEEEIQRCKIDIESQKGVIVTSEQNIEQQKEEIEKEKIAQ
jgi:hypothetical protein